MDVAAENSSNSDSAKNIVRSLLEVKLTAQLETEISSLLGNIKVRASSIKETLKKQKTFMEADVDEEQLAGSEQATSVVDVGDITVDMGADSVSNLSLN